MVVITLIDLLYITALFLPAVGETKELILYGYTCLIWPLAWIIPAWWANPLLLSGCILLIRGKSLGAFICGTLATILAASLLVFPKWRSSWGFGPISQDLRNLINPVKIGYILWAASIIVLAIASFVDLSAKSEKSPAKSEVDLHRDEV
jgi:hypothetical protein